MTISFLHVKLVIETPTIIVKESIKNWYTVYTEYIPARTFYGSIITYLASKGHDPSKLKYSINTSNLYPANYGLSFPAIPYTIACKTNECIDKAILKELIDKLYSGNIKYCENDLVKLYQYLIDKISECKVGNYRIASDYLIKSLVGKPIYCNSKDCNKDNKDKEKCCKHKPLETVVLESVGVSPVTRSSYAGLVYSYEALEPGQCLHGFIACDEQVVEILKNDLNNAPIYMGRGISRGYGRVRVALVSEKFDNKHDLRNIIEESFRNVVNKLGRNYQVLVSLSPLAIGGQGKILPIDIKKDLASIVSMVSELYISWSKLHGILKPIYSMPGHGSLSHMLLKKNYVETINRYEEILLSNPGINFLIPLDIYGKLLVGE